MYFCSFCFFFRSPLHHVQHNSPSIFQYAYSIFILLIIVVVAVLYYCLLMLYISCYFYNLTHKRCCLKLYFCNSSCCCLFLSLINKSIVSNSGRYFLLNFFLSTLFCYNFSFKLAFIQASGKRTKWKKKELIGTVRRIPDGAGTNEFTSTDNKIIVTLWLCHCVEKVSFTHNVNSFQV